MSSKIKSTQFFLFLVFIFFSFSCKNKSEAANLKISKSLEITESVSNIDLLGNKLIVKKQGLVLENIQNGDIEILPEVGAGTVFIRNCKSVNLSVLSKVNIILEGINAVNFLEIKENARIVFRSQIEEKYKKKKRNLFFRKVDEENQVSTIYETEVESGLKPVLEGGVYLSIITKESSSIVLTQEALAEVHEIIDETKPLIVQKDSTYSGYGAREEISNIPEDADFLVVTISDGLNQWTEEISELSDSWTNENLKKNTQYKIIFEYFKSLVGAESSDMNILCGAATITVVPVKEKFAGFTRNGIHISKEYIMKIEDENLFSNPPENVTGFSVHISSASKEAFCRVADIHKLSEIDLKPYIYSNWELCEEASEEGYFIWNLHGLQMMLQLMNILTGIQKLPLLLIFLFYGQKDLNL